MTPGGREKNGDGLKQLLTVLNAPCTLTCWISHWRAYKRLLLERPLKNFSGVSSDMRGAVVDHLSHMLYVGFLVLSDYCRNIIK